MPDMFLLTRPDHDWKISYLYHWAEEVINFADKNSIRKKVFSGKDVSRDNIEQFVTSAKPKLTIFNGHGSENAITGHHDLPMIDASNAHMLQGSIVYAIACSAGSKLGGFIVSKGAETFIGYKDEFKWVIDPQRTTTPLRDKRAEPFKIFSNSICISLLQGKTAHETVAKAVDTGNRLIREYGTSDTVEINDAIRFFLFWDMDKLILEGNENSMFIP